MINLDLQGKFGETIIVDQFYIISVGHNLHCIQV